jgi:hypothetical protein
LVTSSFFPLKCLRKQWFYTRISYLIVWELQLWNPKEPPWW